MRCCNNGLCVHERTLKLSHSLVCAAFIFFMASGVVFGSDEPALAPLKDLSMGASSSTVIDKIKSVGTYSVEPSPWDKRKKVIWQLPDNSSYSNVMFLFTEKDRLSLVRFAVKKEAWPETSRLKKALFQTFRISPDNPARTRVKNQDMVMYIGLNPDYSFFEFTDIKTGDRAFEVYDGKVSAEDKPKKAAESKSGDQK